MPKKARKLKRKASRARGRRRNPANMVRPTPTASQKLLDLCLKAGITSSADIKEGVKFPYHGTLSDATAVRQAKIAFAEANATRKWYLASIGKSGSELSVHEAHKLAVQEWKDARKASGDKSTKRPPAPGAPARTKKGRISGRAGNFKPIPKARAIAYLKRAFRGTYKSIGGGKQLGKRLGDKKVKDWMRSLAGASSSSWIKLNAGGAFLGARLAESIAVVGDAKAAEIFLQQKINAAKYSIKANKTATKALEKKAKKSPSAEITAELVKLAGNLTVLESALASLEKKLENTKKVEVAAAARLRKARARAKSRMKKARARSRKARKSRKMKRSKKKSRRRR